MNKGDPHYYRIQGPTFLVEYDDTQNNANHIHSVWRDFNGDFGEDLLREHYQTTPHGAPQQDASRQDTPRQLLRLSTDPGGNPVQPTSQTLRPRILYREKARYNDEARRAGVVGVVVMSVVFGGDGNIGDIKIIRGLPFGLMEQAISAAKRIRFEPAIESGEPVSVRTNLEFTFDLYPRSLDSHFWQAGLDGVGKPALIDVKKPEYTVAARKNRVEGDVRLIVAFGSNGEIGHIDVIEGLPDGLTEKAIELAKAIKFKPATYSNSDKTVNVWSEMAITFKLDQ
jgi:TonB family protein